jgi:hypothetical protein
VPTVGDCTLQAAGHAWDAVRVPEPLARSTLLVLAGASGAVIGNGFVAVLCWLLPPGSAERWRTPGTRALGPGHHLTVPPPGRTRGPGPYWVVHPTDGRWLTDPAALGAALAAASGTAP